MSKKMDFGDFLERIAMDKATAASKETLEKMKKEFEGKKQAAIEQAVAKTFAELEREVGRLKLLNREIQRTKAEVKRLNKKVNAIVAGTYEEEETAFDPTTFAQSKQDSLSDLLHRKLVKASGGY